MLEPPLFQIPISTAGSAVTERVRVEKRTLLLGIRVAISLGLLGCIYLVGVQTVALWHFRRHSPDEVNKAIHWDRGNAEFYAERARLLQMSIEAADVNEIVRLYETATKLSPQRASYWAELGGSYEWAGRETDARRAYERAQQLFPRSPALNWKLGNFYLRSGRIDEALHAFQTSLLGEPEMAQPVFDLVWRAGIDNSTIVAEMIPRDPGVLGAYLNYLAGTQRLNEASQVWPRLLAAQGQLRPSAAFAYCDALIQAYKADELQAVWAALLEHNRALSAWRRLDYNQLTNGGFENEILNGGLDWRVARLEGVTVRVDNLNHFDGTRSLQITFDGSRNLEYGQVVQFVPVSANTTYRFAAYVRAKGITTDSGPRFVIQDARAASNLRVSTEEVIGTSDWSPQQAQFKTEPETRLLIVKLARRPSRMFDNRIAGTIWIDHVSLTAVD